MGWELEKGEAERKQKKSAFAGIWTQVSRPQFKSDNLDRSAMGPALYLSCFFT